MDSSKSAMALDRFAVKAVEKAAAPDGAEGGDWYRYVIEGACSSITGYSRGSLGEVRHRAEAFVDDLNARANGSGRSTWAPRRSK